MCMLERSREGCAILTCDEGELTTHRTRPSRIAHTSTRLCKLQTVSSCPSPPNPTLVMPCLPLALSFHPRRLSLLNLVPENYASDTKGSLMRGQTSNFSGCVLLLMVFHWPDYVWRYSSLGPRCRRLSTTSHLRKENLSMPSGPASPHRRIPAASSSFAAS
jgi:hypothetical protein